MPKKKLGSVHTAKNGAKYKITAKGARFISGPTKKKKGGSAQVGGSVMKKIGKRATNMVTRAHAATKHFNKKDWEIMAKKADYVLGGSVGSRARNIVKRSGVMSAAKRANYILGG